MVFLYSGAPASSPSPTRESSVLGSDAFLSFLALDLVTAGPKDEGCTQARHLGHRGAGGTELPLRSTMKQMFLSEPCLRSTRVGGRGYVWSNWGVYHARLSRLPRQGHYIPDPPRGLERLTDFYEVSAHPDLKISRVSVSAKKQIWTLGGFLFLLSISVTQSVQKKKGPLGLTINITVVQQNRT